MFGSRLSHSTVATASAALLLSGMIQLAISWMQMQQRKNECACSHSLPSSPTFETDYTWLDDDYPPYLPLDLGPPVALTLEDSRHYSLNGTSADLEWQSLYPGKDLGFIRLGPQKRFFGLSMYHQLHCLDSLRLAILGGTHGHGHPGRNDKRDVEHSSHCLNYLRQTVLCAADLTLEEELAPGTQDVGEGLSAIHVCRDWSRVQKFAQTNWEEWEEWKAQIAVSSRSG